MAIPKETTWIMTLKDENEEEEDVPEVYLPRKQNVRANAVKQLQLKREEDFLNAMLGSLQLPHCSEDDEGVKLTDETNAFDPSRLIKDRIQSWRTERQLVSSSLAEARKTKRSSSTHMSPSPSVSKLKFRPEDTAVKLNNFLSSLQAQMGDAAKELEHMPRKKFEMKEDDILRRPSQLIQLQDSDAGTEKDELRNARKVALSKLSKNSAYRMVHKSTPLEDRPALAEVLQEVHGTYTEQDVSDFLGYNYGIKVEEFTDDE